MIIEMLRKMMLLFPMLITGSLATTLNQAVVPAQRGSAAGIGGSFHHMTPDGKIMGEYEVELPDGRTQHVIYTADHAQGYKANISYRGEATYPSGVQQYTTERYIGIRKHPSGILRSHSNSYGGRIIGNTHNRPKPRKLTPTPVTIPSHKRPSGIVISEPQYGYKARYPQPFTKITGSFDPKYSAKIPSSYIQTGNKHKINKTHEDMLRTKQPIRDQIPKTSRRFSSGITTVPITTTTTSSTTTLDPFYPHYGHSAKLLRLPSRYPSKDSPLSFPQELPTFGIATSYKKSNTIPDKGITNSDKESEPLYIPKYFDFAIKRPPLSYPTL